MPQIFNPTSQLDQQQAVTLETVNVTPDTSPSNEFLPVRTLKNSVASSAPDGYKGADFDAYTADIPDAFATNEQPKLKFLFTVSFQPRSKNSSGFSQTYNGSDSMDDNQFSIKRAGRPNPTITYQDVNFYGFRTKVAIKMDYGTVTLSFYDDVVNRAHSLVTTYLLKVSPIFNMSELSADNLDEFSPNNKSVGVIDHRMGPFQYMRVTHHMLDNANAATGKAKQVTYTYLNPKIINVNLDDLDMTQSDVNSVDITFAYDTVFVEYSDKVDNSSNPITTGISPTTDDYGNISGPSSFI